MTSRVPRPATRPARAAAGRHGPWLLATVLVAVSLLITGEAVGSFLTWLGWSALAPLAEELLRGRPVAGSDKLVHVALFFFHAATLIHAFVPVLAPARPPRGPRAPWPPRASLALAAGLSVLYGGILELAQGAIGRDADPWDLLADAIGVGLCVAWRLARRGR